MPTQPLKWHGGKFYLAKKIVELFPEKYLHYVEPFFGGGAVFFANNLEGKSAVINDLNMDLMNFWQVLQSKNQFIDFYDEICQSPFSELLWNQADNEGDPITKAIKFFIHMRQSRQGLGKDFATLTRRRTRRGKNEQVSSWQTAVQSLPHFREKILDTVILCRTALDVIKQQDGLKTLFYLDPPYLHETRSTTNAYEYEMTFEDHEDLIKQIRKCIGFVVLSGYPSDLYNSLLFDWRTVDFEIDNKASSADEKEIKTERLWLNYDT